MALDIARIERAIGKVDTQRNERRVLRGLGRLRKRAGKVRDMDVLTAYAATLDVHTEEDCRVELLECLGAQRYRHAAKLRAALRRDGAALRRRLKRTCRVVAECLLDGRSAALTDVMASALELAAELSLPARLDRPTLHPYRLKVKELRSVLQLAADAEQHRFVDTLGQIKDAIGKWHDWEELIAIAADVLDHGPRCELVRQAKRISRRKLERALALTNAMRRRYLPAPPRRTRDPSATVKPTPPILEAATAIAA